jgi:hypothetical protein
MAEQRPWHRQFELSWVDFFDGLPVQINAEEDMSRKQQFLDLVLRREDLTELPLQLPDGFDNLGLHNLVTFKSHQETLDEFALEELAGHSVNYRKQHGPSTDEPLPAEDVRLYAVCVRFPHNLLQQLEARQLRPGVYEVRYFATRSLRLIVVNELPLEEQNALLLLFSARIDRVRYGADHYRPRSADTSTLLLDLFERYQTEGLVVPDKRLEEYAREVRERLLQELTTEELRNRLSPEERLKGLSLEERLEGLSLEERLEGLSQDEILAALARRLKVTGPSKAEG